MKKPGELRSFLLAAVPQLKRDPERLLIFIDGGTLASSLEPSSSFEYRYTLQLVVTDYTGSPDIIMLPLLDWLRTNQPELLANPQRRDQVRFEAEVLSNDSVDLSLTIPLTEAVSVKREGSGAITLTHVAEPAPEAAYQARTWQLVANGEVMAEWSAQGG